jgi:ADP-ribose pyrophosphatase
MRVAEEPELLLSTSRFTVVRHTIVTPHGGRQTRESVQHPGAVTIVPLLDDGRICLIRNFRVAVGETLVELPAGTLEPGEDPAGCAARELAEETGYTARTMEAVAQFWMSPGILRERMHLFVATGLTPGTARPAADEEIEMLLVTWEAALEMAGRGAIHDAKSLVGLLFYDRFRRSRIASV